MKRRCYFLLSLSLSLTLVLGCRDRGFVFLEAESFDDAGGWVVDQQGMDVRGTSWMLAHGAGVPVDDASTRVALPCPGRYHAWVLTRNWTAPWSDKEGPGAFSLAVDGQPLGKVCGTTGGEWHWQYAGAFRAEDSAITLSLQDRTGFDGRCRPCLQETAAAASCKRFPGRAEKRRGRVVQYRFSGRPEVSMWTLWRTWSRTAR